MSASKRKGTRAESAVVDWLQRRGWVFAERRAQSGARDKGDITGIPGVCIEVKDTSQILLAAFLGEIHEETENSRARIGFVMMKRRGKPDPEDWYVLMDGKTVARLLIDGGYQGGMR